MKRIFTHPCAACGGYAFAYHEGMHSCTTYYWFCSACGVQMALRFFSGGQDVEQTPVGKRSERTLALFRLRCAPQFMFIYEGRSLDSDLGNEYYYHEGTCPTNLMKCEDIIVDGEVDPHGVFELVTERLTTGPKGRDRQLVLNELTELAQVLSLTHNVKLSGARAAGDEAR